MLLDILIPDETWFEWSSSVLMKGMNESAIVINPIIFAEISSGYKTIEELNERLPNDLYRRDALPYDAAFLAARAFVKYRRNGGSRTTPMPDFYIGAHAEVSNFRILTRDPRRFRKYFPTVELVSP